MTNTNRQAFARLAAMAAATAVTGLLVWALPAGATSFAPTRTDDPVPNGCAPSDCSLREAVLASEANPGQDDIQIFYDEYKLGIATPAGASDSGADGDLDITATLIVNGTGTTIIDAGGIDRVFDVTAGAELTLTGVNIRHGNAKEDGHTTRHSHGGGIHNHGRLFVFDSTIWANTAAAWWGGGGLTNGANASAELHNVSMAGNSTNQAGGAIENLGGSVYLYNTTVSGNTGAPSKAGGIFSIGQNFFLANTIVANNGSGGDCDGTMQLYGSNLASDGSCGIAGPLGQVVPGLTSIRSWDNAFLGYGLLQTSPAVDAGSEDYCPEADQFGTRRPQEGNGDGIATCDIGAYEFVLP